MGTTVDSPADVVEAYRSAELRLRSLLLGDGVVTVGLARHDDQRTRAIASLRHMRDAFEALVAERREIELEDAARAEEASSRSARLEEADARIAQLEDDLLRLAAERAQARPPEELLTAAEAARKLGLSTSTLYRSVRRGEIAAVRRAGAPIGVPASEIRRLVAEPEPAG